jgi:hypothetical protein
MTEADYRAMASEIRDLIPSLLHSESVADLRLLADRYERLAHVSKSTRHTLPDALSNSSARRADMRWRGFLGMPRGQRS